MHKVERRFVEVAGRRVHYRRTGLGPPAVMLHASPANSEMLLHEMQAAAAHFTCFAFDMPGFGNSDPLAGDVLQVSDIAAATAAALEALALPPCPVFGTHTGSAVALELGVGWPGRVTGLVLEGLPIFTEAEAALLFRDYFVTFPPDPLGAHFTSTWMRFRDQFTWFPWPSRDVARLNPIDRPSPAEIQHWVMMYYLAFRSYIPAYRAACFYCQAGIRAAAALDRPAIFLASEEDMLFGHLDRLPPLKQGQRIVRLPHDTPAKHAAIVGFLREMPAAPPARLAPPTRLAGCDPAVQFLDTEDGQIFLRCYGEYGKPAVLLLHDAPGSGLALEPLARKLADQAYVIVPDLPGTGDSDAPAEERPVLEAAADALGAIADTLALEGFSLAAIGAGCAVAAVFATRDDPRLTAIVLESPPQPDEAVAQAIAPDVDLSPEGAHWLKFWLLVRDSQVYAPWFDGTVAAQRATQGNFDADWLHEQTFALMKSRQTYHLLPRAAYRFDSQAALQAAKVAVHQAEPGALLATLRAFIGPEIAP